MTFSIVALDEATGDLGPGSYGHAFANFTTDLDGDDPGFDQLPHLIQKLRDLHKRGLKRAKPARKAAARPRGKTASRAGARRTRG